MKKVNALVIVVTLLAGAGLGYGISKLTARDTAQVSNYAQTETDSASSDDMMASLRNKTGEDFDKEFISHMIDHHQSAIDMANLIEGRTDRTELKKLGRDIIDAQAFEIDQMKTWYAQWGYRTVDLKNDNHNH